MKRLDNNKLVELVDLNQSSKEWLDWRNDGIGSSDVALLMSSEPVFDRTVGTLWKQRVGYERAVELDNEHIRRGKELEPIIRDEVNKILGTNFNPLCIMRKDKPYLRASLDGIDFDRDAILEIKSPSDKVFEKYLKTWQIPENYYLQMQYQMLCSDVEYCYFAFGRQIIIKEGMSDPEYGTDPITKLEIYIIPVKNNYTKQLDIERRCELFWKGVNTKTPVGWSNGELILYDTSPTMFLVICDILQERDLLKIKGLPIPFEKDILKDKNKSFIASVHNLNIAMLVQIKELYPNHHLKIINLVESPFSNKIDIIELNKKNLLNYIKTIL